MSNLSTGCMVTLFVYGDLNLLVDAILISKILHGITVVTKSHVIRVGYHFFINPLQIS